MLRDLPTQMIYTERNTLICIVIYSFNKHVHLLRIRLCARPLGFNKVQNGGGGLEGNRRLALTKNNTNEQKLK